MAPRKVLLIGWDAADWKVIHPLIDAGKLPNVQRLIENGARGQIATLHPPLSPMLWTSIATGMRPFKHGIHGFAEPTPDGRGIQPITNLSRTTKAIWNILNQSDLRSVVIGWWPSHPAEPIDGVMVSDHYHRAGGPLDEGWPLPPHAIHPPHLAETLADLRVHPDHLTPRMVEPFIPLAAQIDQDQDKRLAIFLRILAECMSMHAAALWLIENQPWDFFTVYYDAIDHFCHGFMKYHPPRQSRIEERDFQLYHNVVAMAYQFHDQMLGTLLEKAGEDTTAILMSDHGFHPDHLRRTSIPDIPAGPALEHRELGILVINGPGIKRNEVLDGPSVLDVAPTILTLYGLPVGEDMDGEVLSQVFIEEPHVAFIPSWEQVPGADGRHPPHTRLDPMAAREALQQMIALGYIEPPGENDQIAVDKTIRELRYNLGAAYQDDDRHREAYEIFRELRAADPNEQRFAMRLFVSCQALGLHREMRSIVEDLDGRRRALFEEARSRMEELRSAAESGDWRNLARFQPEVVDYLKAQICIDQRCYPEALIALQRVTEAPGILVETGDVYLRLHRSNDAERVYRRALEIDPDHAPAHLGLCRIALRHGNFADAAHSALDALERIYRYPLAHFLLGRALTGMKEYQRAAAAFRAAIAVNPNFPEAHVRLANLLDKYLDDAASAREHRLLARHMRTRKIRPRAPLAEPDNFTIDHNLAVQVDGSRLEDSVVIVTGLPRSGTSMLMQMLAAGGMSVLTDGLRVADEDNPRGYFEWQPVKALWRDSNWLYEAQGKAIKIVAPLLHALPRGLPCRVIFCERDLDEVLDSQERMRQRQSHPVDTKPERRRLLRDEYARTLGRVTTMLTHRPLTQLLMLDYSAATSDPQGAARKLNAFLGGGLNVANMAAAIDLTLHHHHATSGLPFVL